MKHNATAEADSLGVAYYQFTVTEPELTSAQRSVSAKVYYGDDGTSINWNGAFSAIILGSVQTGRDFVTGGPDRVLTVLRDPPGSNSYSYLEKGTSITESSTYTGSASNDGSETFTQNLGLEVITFAGVGAGVISKTETKNGYSIGFLHSETVGGSNSKESVTTTTTRFQTSDDPAYVGAGADVFVGYSTNISYGSTECVNLIPKDQYDKAPEGKYQIYTAITPLGSPFYLVKQTGIGIAESFATLFAYPQSYIEDNLIPGLLALRNNLLMQPGEADPATLQQMANAQDTTFYISYLTPDDVNFGKSNFDPVFSTVADPDPFDAYNGPSYRMIYPQRDDFTRSDTILYLDQSVENWVKRLKENEEAKINAKLIQNYSFHGGSPIEYSETYSTTKSSSVNFSIMIGANFNTEIGAKVVGQGFDFKIDENLTTEHGGEWIDATEKSTTKGFVLSENGNDYLSVDVLREDVDDVMKTDSVLSQKDFYSSFVFRTKAGATSCPYEDAYKTKYYMPGQYTIDEATKKIEVPEISVEKDFIENVPSGKPADFTLFLRNNSEIKQDNWFTLKIIDGANPYGAKMSIDGAPIGNGRDFLVPAGGTLIKTLEVGKGSAMNYDDLKLVLQSQCEDEISDTVSFTVHYTPSCSDINVLKPNGNWTYNTNLPVIPVNGIDQHYMEVWLNGFDVNYDSFDHIALQYKESSKSDNDWITLMNYYSDSTLYNDAVDNGMNAEMIDAADAGVIRYLFKMDDLPDQRYDLRGVSYCMINNELFENYSEARSGIKDMYNPRLFGSAQPANGILTIENEIRLNFNEQIAEGYLTKNNFQVKGIRNGAQTDHSVSISMDGENDCLATEFDKNYAGKDLTVEMWINSDAPQNATLFSHGNINESLEMSLMTDNHLRIKVGNTTVTSQDAVPFEAGSWAHVALVYSKKGNVSAYYNFNEVISRATVDPYQGSGNIVIGKSISTGGNYFKGKLHNVRVWDKTLSSGTLQINSLSRLSGNEMGLMAYYPMTEARGTVTEDKARGANLIMNGCNWSLPAGRSVAFNGSSSYVRISTGSSAVIDKTMDYTVELWFRGEPGQTNATLLSNGRGDGLDLGGSDGLIWIGFDSNGELGFMTNGFVTGVSGDYLDNNWHHFALSVNRTIGRGQIYVDGNLAGYFDTADIGGVSSAFMYLGTRAWYAEGDASTLHTDNFFKGNIDELRIWDLYRNETLIRDNDNVKLDGNQMGLLAYYPFEYYKEFQGKQELDFTMADMKVQSFPENKVPDATATGSTQSTDIPPVKDLGPVSDLDFDFVVNNDALIINLKESWEKIEKTIVTFTVDGVRDMNGNKNISPFTWSAYIDRNQLKWGETSLNLSKPVYDPLEFTVKAVNKGGSVQNFRMSNMPSWMEVSPDEGSIDPNSSIDVTFTIDPQLNVGTYNEVVYMTSDNNVPEALEINLNVKGQKPDWTVNPADYQYNMSVYGKMRFSNIFSADKEDMLAAFIDGKSVGVTTSTYDKNLDMWYALLTIYNNEKRSDNLEFRMYDASTGKIYSATPDRNIGFVNDAIVGSPGEPVIFDGIQLLFQDISLTQGWNWISFNLFSESLNDVNKTLKNGNWTAQDIIKSSDHFDSYSMINKNWAGDLSLNGGLNNTSMYMVHSSQSQSLSVSGSQIDASVTPVNIRAGQWNAIGYLPGVNLTVKEALAGYDATQGDIVKSQSAFAMFYGNNWTGSLQYMIPNKGYMLLNNSTDNQFLYYPSVINDTKKSAMSDTEPENPAVNYCMFPGNLNIIATAKNITPGDRILAFINGELRGSDAPAYESPANLKFITVNGEDEHTLIDFYLQKEDKTMLHATTTVPFKANSVYGSVEHPMVLSFENDQDRMNVYPSPFNKELKISIPSKTNGHVILRMYDISGKLVYLSSSESTADMRFEKTIDTSTLKPGMYFLHIIENEKSTIKKVVK